MPLPDRRAETLANLLDALIREQEAEGFPLFCITSDDRVSIREAKQIVAALRAVSSLQDRGDQ